MKLLKPIAFIFCGFFLANCTPAPVNQAAQVPAVAPISEDKMVLILLQLHLAEARLNDDRRQVFDSLKLAQPIAQYYKQVLTAARVSESDFRAAFNYYLSDAKKFDAIYSRVIDKASTLDAKARER